MFRKLLSEVLLRIGNAPQDGKRHAELTMATSALCDGRSGRDPLHHPEIAGLHSLS